MVGDLNLGWLECFDSTLAVSHSYVSHQARIAPCICLLQIEGELAEIEAQSAALKVEGEQTIGEYQELRVAINQQEAIICKSILRPDRVLNFLRPGRLIRVRESSVSYASGGQAFAVIYFR